MEQYREGKTVFQVGNQTLRQVRCESPVRKLYRLNPEHDGRPWQTYVGDDRIVGGVQVFTASITRPDENGHRFVFTVGPWWADPNHSAPGYGWISLALTAGTALAEFGRGFQLVSNLLYPKIDGMTVKGKIRGHGIEAKGAELVFWYQGYSAAIDRFLNYAYVSEPLTPLVEDGGLQPFELALSTQSADGWACLGASDVRTHVYGDVPIDQVDMDVVMQIGFIWAPVDLRPVWPEEAVISHNFELGFARSWPIDVTRLPSGVIAFHELEIDYEATHQVYDASGNVIT